MNLEKLFGSKTKVDILKYLIFRRQGISMRALETELWWTFPAIKKQVDSLDDAGVVDIDKENIWRSIHIKAWVEPILKELFFEALKQHLTTLFEGVWDTLKDYYRWNKFWKEIWMDLVLVYNGMEKLENIGLNQHLLYLWVLMNEIRDIDLLIDLSFKWWDSITAKSKQ